MAPGKWVRTRWPWPLPPMFRGPHTWVHPEKTYSLFFFLQIKDSDPETSTASGLCGHLPPAPCSSISSRWGAEDGTRRNCKSISIRKQRPVYLWFILSYPCFQRYGGSVHRDQDKTGPHCVPRDKGGYLLFSLPCLLSLSLWESSLSSLLS